jgi:hypothetical protein
VPRAGTQSGDGEPVRDDRGHWLARGPFVRSRPWAFEEQLLGLAATGNGSVSRSREVPRDPRRSPSPQDRLRRCEGFAVESGKVLVGVVEGIRFVSSIERPDVLEVRGGRFGRQLRLIPTALVDQVIAEEERVVLRETPLGARRGPLLRLRTELARLRVPREAPNSLPT